MTLFIIFHLQTSAPLAVLSGHMSQCRPSPRRVCRYEFDMNVLLPSILLLPYFGVHLTFKVRRVLFHGKNRTNYVGNKRKGAREFIAFSKWIIGESVIAFITCTEIIMSTVSDTMRLLQCTWHPYTTKMQRWKRSTQLPARELLQFTAGGRGAICGYRCDDAPVCKVQCGVRCVLYLCNPCPMHLCKRRTLLYTSNASGSIAVRGSDSSPKLRFVKTFYNFKHRGGGGLPPR